MPFELLNNDTVRLGRASAIRDNVMHDCFFNIGTSGRSARREWVIDGIGLLQSQSLSYVCLNVLFDAKIDSLRSKIYLANDI